MLSRRAEALGVEIRRGLAMTDFSTNRERSHCSVRSHPLRPNGSWGAMEAAVLFARRAALNLRVQSRNLPATPLKLRSPIRRNSSRAET